MIVSAHDTPGAGGLRAARRHANLTQQQVAVLADCSTSYVRLLENGFTPLESNVRARIWRALNENEPAGEAGPSHNLTDDGGLDEAYRRQ